METQTQEIQIQEIQQEILQEPQKETQTSEKQTRTQLFWEIFRFLLVGGGATVVDYLVFWVFDGLLFAPLSSGGVGIFFLTISTALGFCAGLIVNWLLSVQFVFRAVKDKAEARSKKSFAVFTLIGVIGLVITELGVLLLVAILPEISLFGSAELMNTAWKKWIAKAVMTAIVLIWNYVGRKLFVFRS